MCIRDRPPTAGALLCRRVRHGGISEEGLPDRSNGRSPVCFLEQHSPTRAEVLRNHSQLGFGLRR
eukprot:6923701-Alexandrium_andersonii.AAC.1